MEFESLSHDQGVHDESHIENLLSEKLMDGFVLLEKSCPVCATPLVKNDPNEEEEPIDEDGSGSADIRPTMVSSRSFDQPFKPVGGVPFCVACQSHVITQECEISILERCDSLKNKGSILVALQDGSTTYTETVGSQSKKAGEDSFVVEEKKSEDKAMEQIEQLVMEDPMIEEEPVEEPVIQQRVIDVTHLEDTQQPENADVPAKNTHSDEKKEAEGEEQNEEIMAEYSVRREIATKVLGAKMLQGYTLKETQCAKCGMPVMEYKGKVDCVVCPALMKKAKKKLKAQQRLADEAVRLEREIEQRKAEEAAEERRRIEEATLAQQKIHEMEKAKEEAEAARLAERLKYEREERERQAAEAEQARRDAETLRLAELEAEEKRILAEIAAREAEEARAEEEARALELAKQRELNESDEAKALRLERFRRENEARILEKELAAKEKRRLEDIKLMEETKRLEELENRRKQHRISSTEALKADLMGQEYRTRLLHKAKLDKDILKLEQDRLEEEMESRRLAEERRAREEARMIETLEQDAADKAKAAEEAILKAKAALAHVSSARRDIIAQTIAMAEAETVAEAENFIKSHREDYKAPTILPTASQLQRENWETLRTESRSVMTRRIMAGWTLVADFCVGAECENAPLVTKAGKRECVVCGGSGNGRDGAYSVAAEELVHTSQQVGGADEELAQLRQHGVQDSEFPVAPPQTVHTWSAPRTFEEEKDDFETKRNMVSKEIGKRMLKGWTLQDASCPRCVMPLMMDDKGSTDICVLCGLVSNFENNDGSTITTRPHDETLPSASATSRDVVTENGELPSAPTMEEKTQQLESGSVPGPSSELASEPAKQEQVGSEEKKSQYTGMDLVGSIRRSFQRIVPATPKGDPPANKKRNAAKKNGIEPGDEREEAEQAAKREKDITVSIPKDFDLEDEEALKSLVASAKSGTSASTKSRRMDPLEDDNEDGETGLIEVTKSGTIFTASDAMSPESIFNMFMHSPMGAEANSGKKLKFDEVFDLVQVFAAMNFSEKVPEATITQVAADIIAKSGDKGAATTVIHLEDYPSPEPRSPKAFNFDAVDEEASKQKALKSPANKERPTPESMTPRRRKAGGSPRLPPRPGNTSPRKVPVAPRVPSPRKRTTPRGFQIVGGPGDRDFSDVHSVRSEVSRAESVASEALESILQRIEDCKANLTKPGVDLQTQLQTADLMEKLASAAVAMQKLEDAAP